jgi:hypothetical protein
VAGREVGEADQLTPEPSSYHCHCFPVEVISHAVWLYHVFSLSLRDVGLMTFYDTRCTGKSKLRPIQGIESFYGVNSMLHTQTAWSENANLTCWQVRSRLTLRVSPILIIETPPTLRGQFQQVQTLHRIGWRARLPESGQEGHLSWLELVGK